MDLKAWISWSNTLKARLELVSAFPGIVWLAAFLCLCMYYIAALTKNWRKNVDPSARSLLDAPANPDSTCRRCLSILRAALDSAWFMILPPTVWVAFVVSVPISSFAFLAVRDCDCFLLYDLHTGEPTNSICFSPADYSLICPVGAFSAKERSFLAGPSAPSVPAIISEADHQLYSGTIAVAWTTIAIFAIGVPCVFAFVLVWKRHAIEGTPTRLSTALSFLYAEYREGLCAAPGARNAALAKT